MYFDKVFYDEKYEPKTIQLICDKCGEYIQIQYNNEYFSNVKPEYCIVTNGAKIVCKCGNRCQNGLIEPKKISDLSKAGSVAMLGIFSQKVKHQFKCNNCGYEW